MRKVTDFIKRIVHVPDDAKFAGYYHGMIIYDYNSDKEKEISNSNNTANKNKSDLEIER